MTSIVGKQLNAPAQASSQSLISKHIAAAVRGLDVDVPGIGRMYIELLGETARQEVEVEVERVMKAREVVLSPSNEERWEGERAIRTLARAARDPEVHDRPAGSVDEWGQLSTDKVNAAWSCYGDVREQLDPMGVLLTAEEANAITAAVKKKAGPLLRSFGVVRLSAWLLSMVDQLSTSPSPSSSTTGTAEG